MAYVAGEVVPHTSGGARFKAVFVMAMLGRLLQSGHVAPLPRLKNRLFRQGLKGT